MTCQISQLGTLTILDAVGTSKHQRGVGYLRNLSGSLDIMYIPLQEVLQCRREFALPGIHNTPWNIRVLPYTTQNGHV